MYSLIMSNNIKILPSIFSVSEGFKGLLLDAYGVFWDGNERGPLPGTIDAMERLVAKGYTVGILSNSTQLAEKEINKWNKHSIFQDIHYHFVVTSGEVARFIFLNETLPFQTKNNKYWLFGGVHPKFSSHQHIFEGTSFSETSSISEADFIYISIPHIKGEDQTDPNVFINEIKKLKETNLPMVCANPDRFAHEGNPKRAVVRQGTIAALYEEMGGQVFYIGKPYSKAYQLSLENFYKHNIHNPSEILMVGDTPETDIRGARQIGMSSALVTKTGIMSDRFSNESFDSLTKTFRKSDLPNFFIEGL